MFRTIVLAISLASASAFVSPMAAQTRAVALNAKMSTSVPFLKDPTYPEGMIGDARFDPLGLAENFDIKWLREAELKHGRVSMLAVVGMVVAEFVHLPGEAYSNPAPLAAVSQVGPSVMLQIVFGMGAVEYVLNKGKMSSMDMFEVDRAPGDLGFDPMNKMKPNDPDQFALKELQNGRLAMIGVSGMIQSCIMSNAGVFGHHL